MNIKKMKNYTNIDAINDAGQTPLMIAAYYGNAKTAKMLISKGADTMIRDRVGFNARELAEKKNKKDVLKILK
jgi:ankyrin repeat protein